MNKEANVITISRSTFVGAVLLFVIGVAALTGTYLVTSNNYVHHVVSTAMYSTINTVTYASASTRVTGLTAFCYSGSKLIVFYGGSSTSHSCTQNVASPAIPAGPAGTQFPNPTAEANYWHSYNKIATGYVLLSARAGGYAAGADWSSAAVNQAKIWGAVTLEIERKTNDSDASYAALYHTQTTAPLFAWILTTNANPDFVRNVDYLVIERYQSTGIGLGTFDQDIAWARANSVAEKSMIAICAGREAQHCSANLSYIEQEVRYIFTQFPESAGIAFFWYGAMSTNFVHQLDQMMLKVFSDYG